MDELGTTPTRPANYATLNAAWGGLLAATLAAAARTGRDAPPPAELGVVGLATFTAAKALSKEKVGVWMRAPVVEKEPTGERRPKGSGLRYAVGELLTCSRCMGEWCALGLVGLRVLRPREGRILTSVLAVAALNDILQALFAFICARSNETDELKRRAVSATRRAA